MGFKRMLAAFGVGGPSVDTLLGSPYAQPGGELSGEVRIAAGKTDVEIHQVLLGLVTGMESEHAEEFGGEEQHRLAEFYQVQVAGPLRLAAGADARLDFSFGVPWETPITQVHGHPLHGMVMGVRTELVVAQGAEKGDLDPVTITPLASQERVLEGFGQLGFEFKSADVEHGYLHGVHQELPFYQEIEFYPPSVLHGRVNEVELTFVASPHELEVIVEADKHGGIFSGGHDAVGHFRLSHDEAARTDWAGLISGWVETIAAGHRGGGYAHHGSGHDPYAHHEGHGSYGHHNYGPDQGRRGPGWGGVAAGAAAGVAGGLVAGEIMDEVFDDEDDGRDEGGDQEW